MATKTIKINPLLFGGEFAKTKKKEKKEKPRVIPLVSPNVLKNELMRRIKEKKNQDLVDKKEPDLGKYSDEFYESLDYLNSLSTQKTREKQLQNKTLKVHTSEPPIHIELDLPECLKEPFIPQIRPETPAIKLNYKIDNVIPYGCLKGGYKSGYRDWTKTQKHVPFISNIVQPNSDTALREKRLQQLKEKLKQKQNLTFIQNNSTPSLTSSLTPSFTPSLTPSLTSSLTPSPTISFSQDEKPEVNQTVTPDPTPEIDCMVQKRKIKRTVKRKYTLGRSKVHQKVGILIKDRNTRKQILNAQKELKRQPINDVKNYLRDRGMLRIGSSAPNDVIRKIYESSILSGDIKNNNADVMLHNYMKTSTYES